MTYKCCVQVKEMEQILRRRHPNSIPTLMMAANAADLASQPSIKPPSVQVLETRLHKMESELENKDEECNKLLRAMEQKFNVLKVYVVFFLQVISVHVCMFYRLQINALKTWNSLKCKIICSGLEKGV